MCLIIHQSEGTTLPDTLLDDVSETNKDGFGFMYAEQGQLYSLRGVFTAEGIRETYKKYAAGRECVLHWRMATHGRVSRRNAHPFILSGKVAFVHNGILNVRPTHPDVSDTRHYAKHVLSPIANTNPETLFSAEWVAAEEKRIGSGNRFAFMNAEGRVSIVNEDMGVTHEGCWYSNLYAWTPPKSLTSHYTKYYGRGYGWGDDDDYGFDFTPPGKRTTDLVKSDTDTEYEERLKTHRENIATLEEAIEHYGKMGVTMWCVSFPWRAAGKLRESYGMSYDEAKEVLKDFPQEAYKFLYDLVATPEQKAIDEASATPHKVAS